jgi:hypothetical protein
MDAMIKIDQHEKATHKTRETFEKYAKKCNCPAVRPLSRPICGLAGGISPRILAVCAICSGKGRPLGRSVAESISWARRGVATPPRTARAGAPTVKVFLADPDSFV